MAYPLEFSSTLTYANRYDLDELDVFIEGDSNNPMFFSINGLPNQLAYGKHYFNLSTLDASNLQYKLRNSSRILFEFKSINNVVLQSDVVSINQRNGVATCYVEVLQDPKRTFKEIEDGEGTLTVVGSLENKIKDSVGIMNENSIPEKFKGAMNYRCIFPIEIRKNLLNADSPITTNVTHKTETIKGQFSFVKAGISPSKTSTTGTTYTTDGLPNDPFSLPIGDDGGGSPW